MPFEYTPLTGYWSRTTFFSEPSNESTGPVARGGRIAHGLGQHIQFKHGKYHGYVHKDLLKAYDGNIKDLIAEVTMKPSKVLRKGGGQGITSRTVLRGISVYSKYYKPDKLRRRLRDIVFGQRALREFRRNIEANRLGIKSAPVLAAISIGSGFKKSGVIVTAPAEGVEAKTVVKKIGGSAAVRATCMGFFARVLVALHSRNYYHAHVNLSHLFITKTGDVSLIDLDAGVHYRLGIPTAKRLGNLRQLAESLEHYFDQSEVSYFQEAYQNFWSQRHQQSSDSKILRNQVAEN